jgi:hypothetical protein
MTPHPQRCETCKKYDDCPVMSLLKAKRIKSDIPLISAAIIITPEIGCASHSDFQSERDKMLDVPECKMTEGALLKLCDCGNDTFRFVETANWLPEYGWEGDENLRICTKCGKELRCLNDVKNGRSISRKTLAELRQKAGEQG